MSIRDRLVVIQEHADTFVLHHRLVLARVVTSGIGALRRHFGIGGVSSIADTVSCRRGGGTPSRTSSAKSGRLFGREGGTRDSVGSEGS